MCIDWLPFTNWGNSLDWPNPWPFSLSAPFCLCVFVCSGIDHSCILLPCLCVFVCSWRLWSRWWIWITLVAIQPQHNGLTHCLALHYGLIILHQASTMLHWVHHVSHHSTVATALLQLFGFCQIVNQLYKYVLLCCFAFVCLWHCKRAENYHLNGYGPLWPRRQSCWWDLTRIYFEPFA